MTEGEQRPILIPRTTDDYIEHVHDRVREASMETDIEYSFITRLTSSRYAEVGEFRAQVSRIISHSAGEAALLLCLLDSEDDTFIMTLDSYSENGFITPNRPQRIMHNRVQGIGTIEVGYLLGPQNALATVASTVPLEASESVFLDPIDTNTDTLILSGIHRGYN
jgi:hypothetical protein